MIKKLVFGLLVAAASVAVLGQAMKPPAHYLNAAEIMLALDNAAGERPGMAVSRIRITDNYRINMIHRTTAAGAIVHERGTELHYITEGAGTLVTGGVIIRPENGGPATVDGGLARRVSAGDAILIPEGTPHWYQEVEGSVKYLEVRFNEPLN